ncbi:MAG: pentapeptide repeat-containing protein [Acholeplasmatales bacterium]|jgi:transcriptional regulator with XRE-family HTH domain|nr:pentapeptide repeat-containing protein [Acholeplasmatales bacterium]
MNNYEIGEIIAQKRKEKNLAQVDLADLLGVSFQVISKWERGESSPDINTLGRICEILEINPLIFFNVYTQSKPEPIVEVTPQPKVSVGEINVEPQIVITSDEDLDAEEEDDLSDDEQSDHKTSSFDDDEDDDDTQQDDSIFEFKNFGGKIHRGVRNILRNLNVNFSRHSGVVFNEHCPLPKNFSLGVLNDVSFNHTDLSGYHFRSSSFSDCNFNECQFDNLKLIASNISDTKISKTKAGNLLVDASNFSDASIDAVELNNLTCNSTNFDDIKINNFKFYNCNFNSGLYNDIEIVEGTLEKVNFGFNRFNDITFRGVTFKSCYFDRNKFSNTLFENCKMDSMTYSIIKKYKGVKFNNVELI